MTVLSKEVNELIDNISEEKLSFILQNNRGVNGLTSDDENKKEIAFSNLESMRKKGTVTDDDAELAAYRKEKYDN